MEMSHPSHAAPAAPRLDYAMLVALLGVNGAGPRPPARHAAGDGPRADASPEALLVTVILGRSGWRGAARALGGRFASPERRLSERCP